MTVPAAIVCTLLTLIAAQLGFIIYVLLRGLLTISQVMGNLAGTLSGQLEQIRCGLVDVETGISEEMSDLRTTVRNS